MIGKGLRSLLSNIDAEYKTPKGQVEPALAQQAVATSKIALADIQINPKQPRRDFDEQALHELAESIKFMMLFNP